jgi:hypothetical protein
MGGRSETHAVDEGHGSAGFAKELADCFMIRKVQQPR